MGSSFGFITGHGANLGALKYIGVMVNEQDRKKYNNTLSLFTDISRKKGRGFAISTIEECIRSLEYFEEYEKCKILSDIIKGVQSET